MIIQVCSDQISWNISKSKWSHVDIQIYIYTIFHVVSLVWAHVRNSDFVSLDLKNLYELELLN